MSKPMASPEEYTGWILAGMAAAVASLASTIAALWKVQESKNKTDIDDLRKRREEDRDFYRGKIDRMEIDIEECRKDREDLRIICTRMEEQMQLMGESTNKKLDDIRSHQDD